MADTARRIRTAVEQYADPYLQQNLLEAGALEGLQVSESKVGGVVELGIPLMGYMDQFRSSLAAHLAVASGKGGVGKSTVAANLALGWAAGGALW